MNWAEVQESSAFVFTVVDLIVVFGPIVAGLQALGSIGVLNLIFLADLQLDLEAFVRYRVISVGFGLLTSFIPMAFGVVAALLSDIDLRPAILIGSFWASITLIAYPTVAKYGLTKTRPVAAIVGASTITDGDSLVVLAVIHNPEISSESAVSPMTLPGGKSLGG